VGDLYLTDKIGYSEFSAADEWWLTLFARQAAVAVQNAHLYKRVQTSHQRAQTLAELAGILNKSIDPEELFKQITQSSCRLLELPAAALYLRDTGGIHFEMQSQFGLQENLNHPVLMSLDGSIAGKVLANGIPIVVTDTSALQDVSLQPLQDGRVPRSLLVIPIRQSDQVSGVVEVYSAQPREFSSEEVGLLEAFAGQAALAIDKAQLYKHKEEFLSMTAHDLRAPLAAIKMSAGLLGDHLPAGLPPALGRLVTNISRNSERLNNLLNDLLDFTRLEQGKVRLNLERLEIGEAVAATAHTLIPLFEEKTQKLEFDKPLREYWVMVDRRRIEQALVNLMANANKYTPVDGTIQINLQVSGDWVTIRIKDSGPGIPLDEQLRIFDRYYRRTIHEQNNDTNGTGLGLPIARYLIELHGGQIWVESELGNGSTFFVKLPLQTFNQSL
jgi:adenylate cyclase